jgi:peptidoglycan/xylan/chitin deacetylase (PgdA/CDA1 family)
MLLGSRIKVIFILTITTVLFSCSAKTEIAYETQKPVETIKAVEATLPVKPEEAIPVQIKDRNYITAKYGKADSEKFGEKLDGIISRFKPSGKQVALTLDACGGSYDRRITDYLEKKKIKATLFISGKWIDGHEKELKRLSEVSLFQIENHGTTHKPLTSDGRAVYGISGTRGVGEAYDEVMVNSDRLESITGRTPRFFRSGTAFYDDVSICMLNDLGISAAGYTISGDGGATYSKSKIIKTIKGAKPGDIILVHMNHPESDTYEGLVAALQELSDSGFEFITLSEVVENR